MIVVVCLFLLVSIVLLRHSSQSVVEFEISRFNKRIELTDKELIRELNEVLIDKPLQADYRTSDRVINMISKKDRKTLSYFGSSLLSTTDGNLFIIPKELRKRLDSVFTELETELFGKSLLWSEAKILFPKNKDALVTDLETGLNFNIRRKAGTYHADVQPITAQDTEIMKRIFNGSWSWKRRAIILTVDGNKIAASMNGMPHGAGSIKNNNFPGHFCIHFLGSKVHKSNKVDLAHQLMVAKASGKLSEEIYNATPKKLAAIFFTVLKQHDWNTLALTLGYKTSSDKDEVLKKLQLCEDIKNFTIHKTDNETANLLCSIPVTVTWKKKGETSYKTSEILLTLKKSFSEGEWYISTDTIQKLKL